MKKKVMAVLAVVATIAAGCGDDEQAATAAKRSSPPSSSAAQRIEVTAVDFAFEGIPDTLEAGETTVVLANEGEVSHEITIGLLPDDWTIEEVALGSGNSGTKIVGVVGPIGAGATGEVTFDLDPGRYGYICHVREGTKGEEHYRHGMIGDFKVE